jgi:hypothetical protein
MGYDVHITRAEFWALNDGAWITPDEWLATVREDSELQLVSDSEPYPAEWLRDPSGSGTCLHWSEGNVSVKNPTKAAIVKMESLATLLRARIQGDDGEVYMGGEAVVE